MRDFIVKICDNQSARQSAGAGFKENVDMDELISKKAVIEAIDRARANVGHNLERSIGKSIIEILDDVGEDVGKLPSALGTNLAEVGTDCISRQAAIDTLENTKTAISENGERYIAKQNAIMRIDALPSAQPKRGKWILDRSGAYCCSKCMEPCAGYVMMKPRDKFCKMCGAKMEGGQDG